MVSLPYARCGIVGVHKSARGCCDGTWMQVPEPNDKGRFCAIEESHTFPCKVTGMKKSLMIR